MAESEFFDVIVIGGGASGLMAAGTAGMRGARVLLLEKNEKLGKKLYITGKGRCNVTNNCPPEDVLRNIPRNGRFLFSAITAFPPAAMMEFLEAHGCPVKMERGSRVFPQSDHAYSVTDALKSHLRMGGVTLRRAEVRALLLKNAILCGVETDKGTILSDHVIVCTGGCSYPQTGSTGDGYRFAIQAGHTIVPPVGSLVPLEANGCEALQGLSLKNTGVRLLDQNDKTVFQDFGELLFTHFGLSGPTVLSASAHMGKNGPYTLQLDLKPALSEAALDARFLRDLEKHKNRAMLHALYELYPHSLIPILLARCEIPQDLQANALTREARRRLISETKKFRIPITGKRPIAEAIVTSGGVSVAEVDPGTMASKKLKGLFFAGEVLDVNAYTGGFNLQIAWATGHAAGLAAGGT